MSIMEHKTHFLILLFDNSHLSVNKKDCLDNSKQSIIIIIQINFLFFLQVNKLFRNALKVLYSREHVYTLFS